jgi:hypothetical protein
MKDSKFFCWQCGRHLKEHNGQVLFRVVRLPGGNEVKVHKTCEAGAIAWQHLDTMPEKGQGPW